MAKTINVGGARAPEAAEAAEAVEAQAAEVTEEVEAELAAMGPGEMPAEAKEARAQ